MTAVGRLIVCQGQPGLLLAHDRVPVEQVGSLDRAAAVALSRLPDGVALGNLVRITGRWDGRRLSATEVISEEEPAIRPSAVGAVPLPDPPKSLSGAGSQILRELDQAGILSGRRMEFHPLRDTVLVTVSDPHRAHEIVDRHAAPEHFTVRRSMWTSEQLRRARKLALSVPEGELFSAGESYDEHAEAHITISVKLAREALVAAMADLPSGLVSITSFLRAATPERG